MNRPCRTHLKVLLALLPAFFSFDPAFSQGRATGLLPGVGLQSELMVVPRGRLDRLGQPYLPQSALKTNVLYLGSSTLNVSFEFGLGRRWTADLSTGYNPFRLQKESTNQLWFVQPEFRYWFCQRFERHFLGVHGLYGAYNMGQFDFLTSTFREHRYKGSALGAGISWGYHLPMGGGRWAWEFSLGGGYVWLDYDKYACYECDELEASRDRHYLGPTRAAVSLVFMIR